eukprot:505491-Pelagomonas_calceolata.AAC.5
MVDWIPTSWHSSMPKQSDFRIPSCFDVLEKKGKAMTRFEQRREGRDVTPVRLAGLLVRFACSAHDVVL